MTLATWNIGLEEQQAFERTSSIIKAIRENIYPHFEVVNDDMRDYISSGPLPTQTYSPACVASNSALFICTITRCRTEFLALYTNSRCWACIFDRFISRSDPLGLSYCGEINLPQLISTSPGIMPNSTEAPWDHSIYLMILSKGQYPLKKLPANLYSEFYIAPRGYIIASQENKQLIIANTHVATIETSIPHASIGTFLNNTYDSWNDENKGQTIELESLVWNFLRNNQQKYKSAIMVGDFNMGIANFEHNVLAIQPDSWNYIHQLNDIDGSTRWYDD
ncbi:unnamed protein product [Rotaria sp. Silwood1]|nr:unnamed protein product [Rotaria sp. Silwood1]CAF1652532.1 unnamed protein product [Rotaria sp. Silwood1]CAF4990577.1 unnamed protein product [Rotaria sp. Silwood1]